MEFTQTKYAQILFEVQIPKALKLLERIAVALETRMPPEVLHTIGEWEVDQIPGFSTAHMTPEDNDLLVELHAEEAPSAVIEYEYGFIVWLGGPEDFPDNHLIHDKADLFSDDIMNLFELVANAGYHYIRLDNACPIYEGIPTHDW